MGTRDEIGFLQQVHIRGRNRLGDAGAHECGLGTPCRAPPSSPSIPAADWGGQEVREGSLEEVALRRCRSSHQCSSPTKGHRSFLEKLLQSSQLV